MSTSRLALPTDAVLDGRAFPLLLLLGVLLRLAALLAFPVFPLVGNTEDTAFYDEGARSLAKGQGYQWGGQPTAFFPIGWPLILSLAYRIGGESARSGQMVNLLFSLAIVAGGWAMARGLLGARSGRFAALVLALSPHQVVYPALLMSEPAFTALFIGSLAVLATMPTFSPGPVFASGARFVGAGLLMGAATLVRGPALVFPLLAGAWARFGRKATPGASIVAALLFGLGLLLPVAPWAIRNHGVFDRWVLVANDGGMNFLMGNHAGATGARHVPPGGLPDTGDEVADDREGYRRGLQFIQARPLEFLSILPRKLVRLTLPAPLLTYRAELRAKWPLPLALGLLILDQLVHVALWGLALLALIRRRHHPAVLFGSLAIGLWVVVHLAFLGGARYFFPVMPILVLLAAAGRFSERDS
ncbi:MAG: glycosyltransferase family 39 protein [Candidatus Eisenbacteria bacterium]|nr:glycosyltransferase family 39 protein [Candidatus Eisenbacteria bacterium]